MQRLNDLLKKRQVFLEYNYDVPSELSEQIHSAEEEIINGVSETVLGYLPADIEMPADCSVVIGLEFRDGKLVKTGAALNSELEEKFENVQQVADEDAEEEAEENSEDFSERQRSKSIGFSVKFADGKVIKHTTAQRTMIEALRYMGLERASRFRGETFVGFPLIGKEQRTTEGKRWQKMVDGWWVYINMGNERKITCLNGIADMLNIDLEIIPDEETETSVPERNSKKRSLYSLNGSEPMAKNRSVLATVKLYLETEAPYFEDIKAAFPSSLQGSYGVVRSVDEIKQRGLRNKTEESRWFLDSSEILTSVDGIPFAVSTEWGDNFQIFQRHVNEVLNFSLVQV